MAVVATAATEIGNENAIAGRTFHWVRLVNIPNPKCPRKKSYEYICENLLVRCFCGGICTHVAHTCATVSAMVGKAVGTVEWDEEHSYPRLAFHDDIVHLAQEMKDAKVEFTVHVHKTLGGSKARPEIVCSVLVYEYAREFGLQQIGSQACGKHT